MMALWYWILFLFLLCVCVEMTFEGIMHWYYDKVMIWEKYITTINCELPNDVCKLKWQKQKQREKEEKMWRKCNTVPITFTLSNFFVKNKSCTW